MLTALACAMGAAAATAIILIQKKHEEEVYHEAELKAMDELEEMMRQEPMESNAEQSEVEPEPEEEITDDAKADTADTADADKE